MEFHQLSFCTIKILRADLAEVIIDDGVEVNIRQLNEVETFFVDQLSAPFSLVMNKLNHYSFQFDAQVKMGTYEHLNAVAVISYNKTTDTLTQALLEVPRNKKWKLEVFSNREKAIEWAKLQQATSTE